MGTRSILGVEHKSGAIKAQYLQFDGYPTGQGKDFYEWVGASLGETTIFVDKESGKPTPAFFKMVKTYLDYIQYASGHSVGNNWNLKLEKWRDQDVCQEWQYLFDHGGNFHIWDTRSEQEWVIPWEVTKALAEERLIRRVMLYGKEDLFGPFWTALEQSKYPDEEVSVSPEEARVVTYEVHAFPEQGDHGWREAVCVELSGQRIITSLFAEPRYDPFVRRNEQTIPMVTRT